MSHICGQRLSRSAKREMRRNCLIHWCRLRRPLFKRFSMLPQNPKIFILNKSDYVKGSVSCGSATCFISQKIIQRIDLTKPGPQNARRFSSSISYSFNKIFIGHISNIYYFTWQMVAMWETLVIAIEAHMIDPMLGN